MITERIKNSRYDKSNFICIAILETYPNMNAIMKNVTPRNTATPVMM